MNDPIKIQFIATVDQKITEIEEIEVIERCYSPYINPILLVVKKNKELRYKLDAQKLTH